ncbi:MAG: alanyl-tRNA editing protein [Oscillospiraceae bacterium]|nr:alanyl-tRNA editing protein [Oscillospiraceae bacterium]
MKKLFYEDCHLTEFTATVTGCEKCDKGYLVTLDATAFYPEGGGQACDTGTLGGVKVLDVREKDGKLLHLCDGALTVGEAVEGRIDWARRFDLMQQHTGEHILSGLINARFGYHNTGFHVGADVMEVDFDGPITAAELAELEREANEAIWKNQPVKCWIPSPEELPGVTYRTKRPLPWPVRIVQVGDVDSCACCGIHVAHTGEVGIIKILSCASLRGGVRLEMVCGSRAYRYMAAIFDQNRLVSQTFSAKMLETGEAAQKVQEALTREKQRCAELHSKVFASTAAGYEGFGNVVHFEPSLTSAQVRELATCISQTVTGFAAVFSETEAGFAYCLASREADLRELGKKMTATLNGRGGGKPNFQQGSVAATREAIEAFFAGNP